jgi:Helix-turn-helix domain of resolvase
MASIYDSGNYSISDLAEVFSVSRPTVYRTLARQRPALRTGSSPSAFLKSFGCRLASESPGGTNPRAGCGALWVFEDLAGYGACAFGGAMPFAVT